MIQSKGVKGRACVTRRACTTNIFDGVESGPKREARIGSVRDRHAHCSDVTEAASFPIGRLRPGGRTLLMTRQR